MVSKDLNWDLAVHPDASPKMYAPLLEKSREIAILAGGIEESDSFGIYNSAFLCEDGHMRSVHRKTYPPTYGMFEEMRYFSRGNAVRAVTRGSEESAYWCVRISGTSRSRTF